MAGDVIVGDDDAMSLAHTVELVQSVVDVPLSIQCIRWYAEAIARFGVDTIEMQHFAGGGNERSAG